MILNRAENVLDSPLRGCNIGDLQCFRQENLGRQFALCKRVSEI